MIIKYFIKGFLTNEQSKLALPLLLSEEIFGFGFALACDFLKDNVSPEFLKPDTHINDIALGLGITTSTNNFHIFKSCILHSFRYILFHRNIISFCNRKYIFKNKYINRVS